MKLVRFGSLRKRFTLVGLSCPLWMELLWNYIGEDESSFEKGFANAKATICGQRDSKLNSLNYSFKGFS